MHVLVCLHRCMQLQVLDGYLQAMVQTCMYRISPICGYIVNYTHVCIQCGPFRGYSPSVHGMSPSQEYIPMCMGCLPVNRAPLVGVQMGCT